ncbi:MAG: N-acetyltransferase [Lachnospiraceae bacterium]|nr:N-acetyltransferase [Lachnospiraceae bacterium]
MNNLIIRNEQTGDYRKVEELHRNAFWNLGVPGCNEHYLAHILRTHEDFIPELDYVCELDGQVVANVMYTKSKLVDEQGNETGILTFGPIGVAPEVQRKGIGKALLEKSFHEAVRMGYKAIAIFGNPDNYVARGFRSCKKYNVCVEGDVFPAALLVKELEPNFFDGRKYYFHESAAFDINDSDAEAFDKNFEYKEKAFQPSQEEFYIHSHSVIR